MLSEIRRPTSRAKRKRKSTFRRRLLVETLESRDLLASVSGVQLSGSNMTPEGVPVLRVGEALGITWDGDTNLATIEVFKGTSRDGNDKVLVNHFNDVHTDDFGQGRLHVEQKTIANGSFSWIVTRDFFPGSYSVAVTLWDPDDSFATAHSINRFDVVQPDINILEPLAPPSNVQAIATEPHTFELSWVLHAGTDPRLYRSTSPWGPFRQQIFWGGPGDSSREDGHDPERTDTPHLNENGIYCYALRSSNSAGVSGLNEAVTAGEQFYVWPDATDNRGLSNVACAQESSQSSPDPGIQQLPQVNSVSIAGVNQSFPNFGGGDEIEFNIDVVADRLGFELYVGDQNGPIRKVHAGDFNQWTTDHRPDGRDGRDGRLNIEEHHRQPVTSQFPWQVYEDLEPGIYYVLVTGWNFDNDFVGEFSPPFRVVSDGAVVQPPTPSGLSVVVTDEGLSAHWDVSNGANNYRLSRSPSPTGPFNTAEYFDSANGFIDLFNDFTELKENKTYCYVVSATNPAGESSDSDPVCATTPVRTEPPETGHYFDFPFDEGEDEANISTDHQRDGLWHNYQEFLDERVMRRLYDDRLHVGEDWNFGTGNFNEDIENTEIRAIGSGEVVYAGDRAPNVPDAWEGVVIIRHDAPKGTKFLVPEGTLPDSNPVDFVYSFYGHLAADDIRVSTTSPNNMVEIGQVIGSLGTPTPGTPHLHLEVRGPSFLDTYADTRAPDPYLPNNQLADPIGWIHPTEFIRLNKTDVGASCESSQSYTQRQEYELQARSIAYADWTIGQTEPFMCGTVVNVFPDDNGFYAVATKQPNGDLVLAFRGTEPTNVATDVFADFVPAGVGYNQFVSQRDAIRDWVSMQDDPVDFVGHSLGGALAQWTAAYVTADGNRIGDVVTFNSPGIASSTENGADTMASDFVVDLAEDVTHYVSNGDIVSLAGEAFIDGAFTLLNYSASSLVNLVVEKHTSPFFHDEISVLVDDPANPLQKIPSGEVNTRVATPTPIFESDNVSVLNSPVFFFPSPDYWKFLIVGAAIETAARNFVGGRVGETLMSHGTMRQFVEQKRVEIGQRWDSIAALTASEQPGAVDIKLPTIRLTERFSNLDFIAIDASVSLRDGKLRVQGGFDTPALWNTRIDFTDENYIEISTEGKIELVGEIFISRDILPGRWELKNTTVKFDTTQDLLTLGSELVIPRIIPGLGRGIRAKATFIGGELDTISVDAGTEGNPLQQPLGGTGIFLQSGSGTLGNLTSEPLEPEVAGDFRLTYGPEFPSIDLPGFLGGPTPEISLASLEVAGRVDSELLAGDAELQILNGLIVDASGRVSIDRSTSAWSAGLSGNFFSGAIDGQIDFEANSPQERLHQFNASIATSVDARRFGCFPGINTIDASGEVYTTYQSSAFGVPERLVTAGIKFAVDLDSPLFGGLSRLFAKP